MSSRQRLLDAAARAGVDTSLLNLQCSLGAISPTSIALLARCSTVLNSRSSAASIDDLRASGERTVRATCADTLRMLSRVGLSDLTSDDVLGFHFYIPSFPRSCLVVRRCASEPVNLDSTVHGMFIGSFFFRPLLSTLFPMLCRATPESFCVDPEPHPAAYGSLDTLPSYAAAHQQLREMASDPATIEGKASAACKLRPNVFALNFCRDGCLVGGTDKKTLVPVYLTLANFTTPFAGLGGTSGLWALYKPFEDPGGVSKEQQALCRRLLNQEVLDVFYEILDEHKAGILWELRPDDVLLLVPKCKLRPADHPQRQLDMLCKTTPQACAPCMFCTVGRGGVCSTLAASRKDFEDMAAAAKLAPFSAGGAAPAGALPRAKLLEGAQFLGVTPSGRVQAPLDKGWRVTLPGWACKNGGGPDSLHAVRGQMRGAIRAMLTRAREEGLFSGDEFSLRVQRLRPFSGAWSQLLLPSESMVVDAAAHGKNKKTGAKIATKRFASLLLLLPALVEGCDDEDWAAVAQACLLLVRVDHVMKQEELSKADIKVLDLLCRATVRALRKFPALRRTIKVHLLLHLASFVPDCGPGNATDVKLLEMLHRVMISLRARVKPTLGKELKDSRLPAILRRAKLVSGVEVAAAAAAALAGAGAGAGVNLAGRLDASFAPPFKPPFLPSADAGLPELGGFLSPAAQPREPAGGLRATGKRKGAPLNFLDPPPYLAALAAVVVLDHLGVAPPAGFSAEARRHWETRLLGATALNGGKLPTLGGFRSPDHYDKSKCSLTVEGAAMICGAVCIHEHKRLHFRVVAGAAYTEGTPALDVARGPFVSFPVAPGFPWAACGKFALGRVEAVLTVPNKRALVPGSGAALPPTCYVVLRMCAHRALEQAALCARVPALEDFMEPWEWASSPHRAPVYEIVTADFILREEHVQPRFGYDFGDDQSGCWMWRYPQGGMEGRVPMPTLPQGAEAEDPEEEESWWAGREGAPEGGDDEEEGGDGSGDEKEDSDVDSSDSDGFCLSDSGDSSSEAGSEAGGGGGGGGGGAAAGGKRGRRREPAPAAPSSKGIQKSSKK